MVEGAGGENILGYYLGRLDRPEYGVGKQAEKEKERARVSISAVH